jgi:acyl-CoA reductase-like NAD-dependent aldehyde dehydrogenase
MREQNLFINGAWVPGVDTFEVRDPFDQTLVGTVAVASADQAAEAVTAAKNAMLTGWPAAKRADLLLATSRLVAERSEDFAQLLRSEAGKPIAAARGEVDRGVSTLRIAAEEARRLPAEAVQFDEISPGVTPLGFTIPQPYGVVAAITPFNFPLNLVLHKVAPALAAAQAAGPTIRIPDNRSASIAFRVRAGRFLFWPGKQRPTQAGKYNTQMAFVLQMILRISTS